MTEHDYTVLQLNETVRDLLNGGFPGPFWIRGIVTGLRRVSGRGHTYFQLADPGPAGGQPGAVVDCALFAGDRASITMNAGRHGTVFELENNTEVRILARVNFWERSGRFQIVMKDADHTFSGDSEAIHLKKLVEKLSASGVLHENGTLEMPMLPLTVGLVTARGSAAEKDFLKTLEESKYPFRVYTAGALMQGPETASSVCSSFNRLLSSSACDMLDAVVLTRGGGSQTDLAWFNREIIAGTIAQLPWPVISAIGHEVDNTLPDYAAHTRAKTPTHAATILVNRVAAFDDRISNLATGLVSGFTPRISIERMKLNTLAAGMATGLSSIPRRRREQLNRLLSSISLAAGNRFRNSERKLVNLENTVNTRDPEKMLELGWAVVRDSSGRTVRNASDVNPGDRLAVRVSGGKLGVLVEERE